MNNHYSALYAAFEVAIRTALDAAGVEGLKKTSMFGSNSRRPSEMKQAA